jgi:hypothetical protein
MTNRLNVHVSSSTARPGIVTYRFPNVPNFPRGTVCDWAVIVPCDMYALNPQLSLGGVSISLLSIEYYQLSETFHTSIP